MKRRKTGFTLVEIMIVVAIIGLLAMIAAPAFGRARQRAMFARLANDFRVFGGAFLTYSVENGGYPPDSNVVLPPGAGMEQYLDESKWNETTPLGGNFNWEGPDYYPYAGIAINTPDALQSVFEKFDEYSDDSSLGSGDFQKTSNGRFTYIIEWM